MDDGDIHDGQSDSLERRKKRRNLLHRPLKPYTTLDNPSEERPWSIVEHRSCSEGRTLHLHSSYSSRDEATRHIAEAMSDLRAFIVAYDARQVNSTIRRGIQWDYYYFFDPFDIYSFAFTIEYGTSTNEVLHTALRHYHYNDIEHQPIKEIISPADEPTPERPWKVVEYRLTSIGLNTYTYGSYSSKKQAQEASHIAMDDVDRFVEDHGGIWIKTFKASDNRYYREFSFKNNEIIIAFSLCVEFHEFPR